MMTLYHLQIKQQQPAGVNDAEMLNKDQHSKGSAVNFEVIEMQESTNSAHHSANGNGVVETLNTDISSGVRERKKGAEQPK